MQVALFEAVKLPGWHKCLAAVHTALGEGASATAVDGQGWTALHIAARYNADPEAVAAVIKLLAEVGIDVNAKTSNAFANPVLNLAVQNPCSGGDSSSADAACSRC